MENTPQKIAWEERYGDDSGVEYAVRYDATRSNMCDGGPVVTIEHMENVDWPLARLDWLIQCLTQIRDLAHNAMVSGGGTPSA